MVLAVVESRGVEVVDVYSVVAGAGGGELDTRTRFLPMRQPHTRLRHPLMRRRCSRMSLRTWSSNLLPSGTGWRR